MTYVMGRFRKWLVAGLTSFGVGASISGLALGGCDGPCPTGPPCRNDSFEIDSHGRCIVSIQAIDKTICGNVVHMDCADGGPRDDRANVFPPTPSRPSAPTASTCDVQVTLDDGTTVALSVQFVPDDSPCTCGAAYKVYPPVVALSAANIDASADANAAHDAHIDAVDGAGDVSAIDP